MNDTFIIRSEERGIYYLMRINPRFDYTDSNNNNPVFVCANSSSNIGIVCPTGLLLLGWAKKMG